MTERVLITGAAGSIGSMLRPRLARAGRVLRLFDIAPIPDPVDGEEPVTGSVTDLAAVTAACRGADAVVHLAGVVAEVDWPRIGSVNIDGTRNVLAAAAAVGTRRVILASSNHAAGFRTRDEAGPGGLPADVPPRPDTFYGVSKAAMEALGSVYADRYGMDVLAARIGTCRDRPVDTRALATWLSPDDTGRMVEAALSAPGFGFRLIWGISANTRRWWSLAEGNAIGFVPLDDAEAYAAALVAAEGEPDPAAPVHRRVGGPFCDLPLGGGS